MANGIHRNENVQIKIIRSDVGAPLIEFYYENCKMGVMK